MNETKFFDSIRNSGIMGSLSQSEVNGTNFILAALEKANYPLSWAAYALATAFHETAGTMLPISEMGGTAYFTRLYDVLGQNPARARTYGNTKPGDGPKYHGRGYVQLTWKINYSKATTKTGKDLINHPELAKDPAIAAEIMVSGMQGGWFTGKSTADYLPSSGPANLLQFTTSRRIINGTDKADKIARYAILFQNALKDANW